MASPDIISHRGIGFGPENTLVSARNVFKFGRQVKKKTGKGIGLEIDADRTRDNIAVLLHDGTLDRTTTGKGSLHEYSYGELAKLSAGSKYGEQYSKEQVPRLDDLFRLATKVEVFAAQPTIEEELIIDLKDPDPTDLVIVDLVKSHGILNRVKFSSEYPAAILAVKRHEPQATVGLVTEDFDLEKQVARLAATGIDYISPWINTTTSELMIASKDHDLALYPWFDATQLEWDDDTRSMIDKVAPNVKGIITNHTKQVAEHLYGTIFAA